MNTYITTPIFYVNAEPHLGHAYTTIVADTYCRFAKLTGKNVRFQTGTDEHGDKIDEAAQKAGVTPQEYADKISGMFRDSWPGLSIEYDNFIRTTDQNHKAVVRETLQKLYDKGDIVFLQPKDFLVGDLAGHFNHVCLEYFIAEFTVAIQNILQPAKTANHLL